MSAVEAPTLPTGIHWHGNGWYAPRMVRGIQVYYYLGPQRMGIEAARAKAAGSSMGEPLHVVSKEGFTYVY